jgi:hypothetical protein
VPISKADFMAGKVKGRIWKVNEGLPCFSLVNFFSPG